MVEDHLGRALDEQHVAVTRPVQRRHELVLGFERNGVEARRGRRFRGAIEAELRREGIERALGRVALDLPLPLLLEEFRVVAQSRHPSHEFQRLWLLAERLAALPDLALGRVAVSFDLERPVGRHDRGHHHLHERQGARLVGADARHGAERLDRRQAADDRVALRHPLHADGERDRDQSRQALRDHRNRDADHRLK
jgi:hypothetical protein